MVKEAWGHRLRLVGNRRTTKTQKGQRKSSGREKKKKT